MELYPEAQKRAQAEIDEILGGTRLPMLADQELLPYTWALILEVFRWGPATPQGALLVIVHQLLITIHRVGVPHHLIEDDIYEGYFILKGTIVIANQWCVTALQSECPVSLTV